MKLQFDPFQVFQNSRTPAGLYARMKWLDQGREKNFRRDYDKSVSELLQGQAADGSWSQSPLLTIRRLFGLHLTVRENTRTIKKSLHWLLNYCVASFPKKSLLLKDRLTYRGLNSLPFSPGCSGYFVYGAALFLSTIFSMGYDERVLVMYKALAERGQKNNGRWCGLSCSSNILRAFIVHPSFKSHKATRLAVEALANEQKTYGIWKSPIPFYRTVNALAHLNSREVDAQLKTAFKMLCLSQNRDGTWGRTDKEWKTFLILHAFKNKGEL